MNYIMLNDDENNTLAKIVEDCYLECIRDLRGRSDNGIPQYYQISDKCLEFIADFGINSVTYRGYPMSAMHALDTLLKQVLFDGGLSFKYDNMIIRPYQTKLYDEEEIKNE